MRDNGRWMIPGRCLIGSNQFATTLVKWPDNPLLFKLKRHVEQIHLGNWPLQNSIMLITVRANKKQRNKTYYFSNSIWNESQMFCSSSGRKKKCPLSLLLLLEHFTVKAPPPSAIERLHVESTVSWRHVEACDWSARIVCRVQSLFRKTAKKKSGGGVCQSRSLEVWK